MAVEDKCFFFRRDRVEFFIEKKNGIGHQNGNKLLASGSRFQNYLLFNYILDKGAQNIKIRTGETNAVALPLIGFCSKSAVAQSIEMIADFSAGRILRKYAKLWEIAMQAWKTAMPAFQHSFFCSKKGEVRPLKILMANTEYQ